MVRVTRARQTDPMSAAATIIHADLDAFYASVEVRDEPRLRGKPVAVGGGVVLAATYEARRHGVGSAMSAAEALRRCPGLVVVPARFAAYVEASRAVMEIFERFTPRVEPISIDEAFLDVRGALRLFGSPTEIGTAVRTAVRSEVDLPISVGIATTKHLAKIASRCAKPDGLVTVEPGTEERFLGPLPVTYLWGVGPVGEQRLARHGIATIGDLAALPPATLAAWMGPHWGEHLWHLSHNHDHRAVERRETAGSVGAQSAGDATDPDTRHRALLALSDRIGARLRRRGAAGRRVTVRVRFEQMRSVTRALTLPGPIDETTALYRVAAGLADAVVAECPTERVTLVGIAVSALSIRPHLQLELPMDGIGGDPVIRSGSEPATRRRDVDAAVDAARNRYGRGAVRRAAILDSGIEQRSPTEDLEFSG